jgi:hypothetical protein
MGDQTDSRTDIPMLIGTLFSYSERDSRSEKEWGLSLSLLTFCLLVNTLRERNLCNERPNYFILMYYIYYVYIDNVLMLMCEMYYAIQETMLQLRRSRVRFLMRSFNFSIELLLPAAL